MHQLLSPRMLYEFPEYLDNLNTIPPIENLITSISKVFSEEFSILCELDYYEEIFSKEVSSHGKFISCLCLETGTLYHYCLDVKRHQNGFDLIPKSKYFNHVLVFRWKSVMEIDNAKFYF